MTKTATTEPAAQTAVATPKTKEESTVLGGMLTAATDGCAAVVATYRAPAFKHWRDITAEDAAAALELTVESVQLGLLGDMEAALVSQAVALNAMFVSLANRAATQGSRENIVAMTTLALKAQAQSRATISALVELKHPRGATFIKQANVTSGPQQVNNGGVTANPHAPAREIDRPAPPNELSAPEHVDGRTILHPGAAGTSGGTHPALAPVGIVHRA